MQILRKTIFLTAAAVATAFASCDNDNDDDNGKGGGEGKSDYLMLAHAYGTYYHTYWGENAGDYYLVLTDKDLDNEERPYVHRIDIDFLSVVATDPTNARPLDGEYTVGTSESNRPGVFIEGFLAAGPDGQPGIFGTYWNQPSDTEETSTVHAIVGGKMRIKTVNGVTTILADFIDERDSTLRVGYEGSLDFENQMNDSYRGYSRLSDNYAMNPDAPVVSMKKITDECTAQYDRWDLHFYEKNCYETQGGEGFYLWFKLVTAPGQSYVPAGTYQATSAPDPGFLPGEAMETGTETLRAFNTWFYAGRSPHAPLTNGTLTVKTSNGTDYEVSFSMGDDHPMPYLVTGSFTGTVRTL